MYVAFEVALTYLYAHWYTFWNRGFRQKQCKRFLRFLASLMKSGGTLTKRY